MPSLPDTFVITVTEEHVRAGRPKACLACPISLAFKDVMKEQVPIAMGSPVSVFADYGTLHAHNGIEVAAYDTPADEREFMQAFDDFKINYPFRPRVFTFTRRLADPLDE